MFNIKAKKMLPFQKGDVFKTYGSNKKILEAVKFSLNRLRRVYLN